MALVASHQLYATLCAVVARRDGKHALVGGFSIGVVRGRPQTVCLGNQQLRGFFLAPLQFESVGGIGRLCLDGLLELANAGLVLAGLYFAQALIVEATAGASG